MKENSFYLKALPLSVAQLIILAPAVCAQGTTVSEKAIERSHWYVAPRQLQIVDQRPIITDFRTPEVRPGQIAIPPGPGAVGGPGGGALGDPSGGAGGGSQVIPGDGMPIPGGSGPGYRSPDAGMSTLPKSGFGGSNIPARGLGPRGILPTVTTGVVGKMMNQPRAKAPVVGAHAVPNRGPAATVASKPSAPSIVSYGNNYSSPTAYGSSLRDSKSVRGYLLNHK